MSTKLSQIANAPSPPLLTDTLIGVGGGTTDYQYTVSQLASVVGGGMAIGGAVTGGTTGSVLFIDGSGDLAQDNANFFWDNTNFNLEINGSGTGQGVLQIAGKNALYRVPNGSGDNWFEGGAGNTSVTGYNNFGTGAGTLGHLTSGFNNTAVGDGALFDCTTGSGNFAFGTDALSDLINATGNFAIGSGALANLDLGGGTGSAANFAVGNGALNALQSGSENVGMGGNALASLTGGSGNVGIGFSPWGSLTAGSYNIAIGIAVARSFTTASGNTVIGPFAGQSITSGNYNTLIGGWEGPSGALSSVIAITDGTGAASANPNFINGVDYKYTTSNVWSFQNLTAAQGLHVYNTTDSGAPPTNYERAVLDWNITSNVFTVGTPSSSAGGTGTLRETRFYTVGLPALYVVKNVSGNNWFEGNAGNFTVTGSSNFATGDAALQHISTGTNNTAIGSQALQQTTTGVSNFALGTIAMAFNTSGSNNTAIGVAAMELGSTNDNNVAIGAGTLQLLGISGVDYTSNIAIGSQALNQIRTGNFNVGIGASAGSAFTDGNFNILIGEFTGGTLAGSNNNYNIMMGFEAGNNIINGANNVLIGGWKGPATSLSSIIAIGLGNTPTQPQLDWGYLVSDVWSFKDSTNPQGLHIYNTWDNAVPVVNYERAVLDWNLTANVFTVGTPSSSAGGTGTLRETRLYTLGLPAIFVVPNGAGNNWFEGNAGNFTLSGNNNFGTGDGCLASITTGYQNTAVGNNALGSLTTGILNFAMGRGALQHNVSGNNNTAIGNQSLYVSTGSFNTAIGGAALGAATSASLNVAVGESALSTVVTGQNNTAIGYNAATSVPGNSTANTFVGANTGPPAYGIDSFNSTFVGEGAGRSLQSAYVSVFLGGWGGPARSVSDIIAISDGFGRLLMDWNFITTNVWSLENTVFGAQGLHIYNTLDSEISPANWERGCLDWNLTSNVFRVASQAAGTGTVRLIAIDGFQKAGAPAAGDLPSGTCALINDTSGGNTWLVYNNSGTIRKVQLT